MRDIQYLFNETDPYIHTYWKHVGLGYDYTSEQEKDYENEYRIKDDPEGVWADFHNKLIDQGKKAYLLSFFENRLVQGKSYKRDFEYMAELIKDGKNLKKIGKILDALDEQLYNALKTNTTYMNGLGKVEETYSKAAKAAQAYTNFMKDKGKLEEVFEKIGDLYEVNKTLFDRLGNKTNLIAACEDYINDRQGHSVLIADDDFIKLRSLLDKIKQHKQQKDKISESEDTLKKSFHQLITYLQISEQSIVSNITKKAINEAEKDVKKAINNHQSTKGQDLLSFVPYLVSTGKGEEEKDPAQQKTDKDILISTEYFKVKTEKINNHLTFDFIYADLSMKFYTQFFDKDTEKLNKELGTVDLGSSGYKLWEAFMVAKNDAGIQEKEYYYLVNSLEHTMKYNNDTTRLSELKDILIKRFFLDTLISRSKGKNEFNDFLFVNGRAYPVIGIFKDIFMTETKEQKLSFSGLIGKKESSLSGIANSIKKIYKVSEEERSENIHFNNLRNALVNVPLSGKLSGLQNFTKNVVSWGEWTNISEE